MKILSAKVIVCSPGRNFVTLKIATDDGINGVGDATLNGASWRSPATWKITWRRPDRARSCADGGHLALPLPRRVLAARAVTMTAIAAIDMALWDIKGKALGVPVYNLLGGKSRNQVLVYAHATGRDIAETVDEVERYRQMGYTAIRAQSGVPGLKSTYGVAKDDKYYEPAERGLPSESLWSTEKYLRHVPKLFEALRKTLGDDLDLLHDVHHRLTPIEAARLGKELEPIIFSGWKTQSRPSCKRASSSSAATRLLHWRWARCSTAFGTQNNCIREQLIDYLRMSVVHGGGLTAMKKIADFAAIYHVRTGCHGASDMSPVCMAAALHLDIAINNFGIQEHMLHNTQTEETFPHAYFFRDGSMYPGDGPGLGVDIREDVAAGFPYQRAYLPVNRKEDGTLFHW